MRIHKNICVRSAALAVLGLALSLAFVTQTTGATQSTECLGLIAALRAETEGVSIVGKNAEKNRAGLLGKLDGATTSLNRGKLCDAISKLNDFKVKVNQLIASGSINTDPAAGTTGLDLIEGADASIACVQAAVVAGGITCSVIE